MLYIGIDTGSHTGFAVWDTSLKRFVRLECLQLHQALFEVVRIAKAHDPNVIVFFEDARQRKWYGSREQAFNRLQGAGSVKRDSQIWEDFLTDYKIPFNAIAPKNNTTKLTAEQFARITGYEGKTNEHSRDAAMLVYGR